jgi:hypothetical protein
MPSCNYLKPLRFKACLIQENLSHAAYDQNDKIKTIIIIRLIILFYGREAGFNGVQQAPTESKDIKANIYKIRDMPGLRLARSVPLEISIGGNFIQASRT